MVDGDAYSKAGGFILPPDGRRRELVETRYRLAVDENLSISHSIDQASRRAVTPIKRGPAHPDMHYVD
jgi:hypothetical protein